MLRVTPQHTVMPEHEIEIYLTEGLKNVEPLYGFVVQYALCGTIVRVAVLSNTVVLADRA